MKNIMLSLLVVTSGCQWINDYSNGKTKSEKLSPSVAASMKQNFQTTGIAGEEGGTVDFAPCIITLRTSSITCDFDVLVFDSVIKAGEQFIGARQPQALRFTSDHNLIVSDGVGPEQFLEKKSESRYVAVNAINGLREVIKNSDGTFTGFLDGHGTEVYRIFDSNNRMIKSIDPKTRLTSTFKYNVNGLLESRQDPGNTINVTYGQNRMPSKIDMASGQRVFVIENSEKAIQVSDGQKPFLYFVRGMGDDRNLITSIMFGEKRLDFTYQNGLLKTVMNSNGSGVSIDGTLAGGNGQVVVKDSKTGLVQYLAQFQDNRIVHRASPRENQKLTRDEYGRILTLDDANGRKTSFDYDSFGHAIAVINQTSGTPKQINKTVFNNFGQILSFNSGPMTTTYVYDNKGRATNQKTISPESTHTILIDKFDELGRPIHQIEETISRQTKEISVVYDASGNIGTRNIDQGFSQTTITANPQTSTTQSEQKDKFGGIEIIKKVTNNLNQSVKEFRRTTDYAGRVEEVFSEAVTGGVQKTESNEIGPVVTSLYDANGQLVKISTIYTKDEIFRWAAESSSPQPSQPNSPSNDRNSVNNRGGITEVKNTPEKGVAKIESHNERKTESKTIGH